ncbi:hypothetical protein L2E82_37847 [Cichorium intybus]|uniref:Uncharacterized protein n=1 Tax=Cichorium intybus TaxID=13427 RepID=A0ACB9AG50_CICIN|nr:hypothetical protein L2E82_37847 [Cichorium intybus]
MTNVIGNMHCRARTLPPVVRLHFRLQSQSGNPGDGHEGERRMGGAIDESMMASDVCDLEPTSHFFFLLESLIVVNPTGRESDSRHWQ